MAEDSFNLHSFDGTVKVSGKYEMIITLPKDVWDDIDDSQNYVGKELKKMKEILEEQGFSLKIGIPTISPI